MDCTGVSFRDGIIKDGYLWFFENNIQALCRMDLCNLKMDIIAEYEGDEKFIVRRIFLFRDWFYMVKDYSTEILAYSIKNQQNGVGFFLIKPSAEDKDKTSFVIHFVYNDCIYFFPSSLDKKIVCFYLDTQKYIEETPPEEGLENKMVRLEGINYCCFYEGTVWFVDKGTPYYIRYGIADKKAILFKTKDEGVALTGIGFDGRHIWLTQENRGDILCVGEPRVKVQEVQRYSWLHNLKKWMLILPEQGGFLLLIQKDTLGKFVVELPLTQTRKGDSGKSKITDCCEWGDDVYLFPHGTRDSILILNTVTKKVRQVKPRYPNYLEIYFKHNTICLESENIGLLNFLDFCG